MDEEHTSVLHELNDVQIRISTLFQDLIRERNDYKHISEKLTKQLEEVSSEIDCLKNEVKKLNEKKDSYERNNKDMQSIIDEGINILKTVNLTSENFSNQHKFVFESLKKIFLELSRHLGYFKANRSVNKVSSGEIVYNDANKCKSNDKEAEKELELINDINFSTNFYLDEDDQKSVKNESISGKNSSNTVLKTLFQNTYEAIKTLKGSSSSENDSCDSELVNTAVNAKIFRAVPPSPEDEDRLNRSPVFKDCGSRKHESFSNEENSHRSSKSDKPVNDEFLSRSSSFIFSPWKKSPQRNEKSPSLSKRSKKKLDIRSPNKSPLAFLKKSNTREAEVSFLGVRKLRQTVLNIDCYKRKSTDEGLENRENENCKSENETNRSKDKKLLVDFEDDDFINESPKKTEYSLDDVKNKNDAPFTTLSQTLELDLDETYVSSSIIRKSNMSKKRELEKLIVEQTPIKRPAREKSPEYDSVPFVYRREPIRKKSERMKLPGHACLECKKYYENVFEDIDSKDLEKILNKCSRHRDKNPPALDDTPPDYWKPYLTCTTLSPSKDGASDGGYN